MRQISFDISNLKKQHTTTTLRKNKIKVMESESTGGLITIENKNNREATITESIQHQNTQRRISIDSSVSQFNASATELQNIQARLHRSIHEGKKDFCLDI